MEAEVVVKKWGNSVGVLIPKEVVRRENIKENERIVIEIKKRQVGKTFLGMVSDWNESAQMVKDEAREGWK